MLSEIYNNIYICIWLALAVIDCQQYRLPDRLLWLLILCSLRTRSYTFALPVLRVAIYFVFLYLIYLGLEYCGIFLIGLGDLKLLSCATLLHGWQMVSTSLLLACLTMLPCFLALYLRRRQAVLLPFGPFFVLACISQLRTNFYY